jgi:hypothetical protein
MISLLVATDKKEIYQFNQLQNKKEFQRFYELLYYESDFLQEFFDEPVWTVNKQYCFTLFELIF